MSYPERDIERVLTGLRDSSLPPGMEDRILIALEEHRTQPSLRWLSILPTRRKIVGASSLAMAAALIVVFSCAGHRRHTSQSPAAAVVALHPLPSVVDTEVVTRPSAPLARTVKLRRVQVVLRQKTKITDETGPISTPAPPIPLTAQERFLLRIAHHGRTEELAQISNENKAAKEKQEAAAFQAFFEPLIIKFGESE